MVDLAGPQIKIGQFQDGKPIDIKQDQELKISYDTSVLGNAETATISCSRPISVNVGDKFSIGEGKLLCEVVNDMGDHLVVKCLNACELSEMQSVNLPSEYFNNTVITQKDELDISEFVLKSEVDFLSIPCVRKPEHVQRVREILGPQGEMIKIFSRIENLEGLENFDQILELSDGVIIMRSSLENEIQDQEKLFVAQKWMIWRANLMAKTVVIGSQILESMVKSERASRYEVQDISALIVDGSDSIMLQNETSIGKHPEKAINQLAKCCVESEKILDYRQQYQEIKQNSPVSYGTVDSVALSAVQSSLELASKTILVQSSSGNLAKMISKYRPESRVVAFSFD
mmetsp:Transcript_11812/g.19959  ORF Transcript_11812/g.19959 Transcript_11812/m.19959 type:complete len:344 (-) Transcript_11812:229-1260(-)